MIRQIVRTPVRFSGKEDVVVLPLFQGERRLGGPGKKLDVLCRSGISDYIRKSRFSLEAGETALVGFAFEKAPNHVLLVGLGKRGAAAPLRMMQAGASASMAVGSRGFRSCHLLADSLLGLEREEENLRAFLKGFLLGRYSFSVKSTPPSTRGMRKLVVASDHPKRVTRAIQMSRLVSHFACYTRDLVNRPGEDMTPARMAEEAGALAHEHGLECRVMRRAEIAKLGMGALLGVARGSAEEPCFITLRYNRGASARRGVPLVCLVGKGVTFDSGGLSIKPWQNMSEMKGDMAGGAVVMSVIAAASRLALPAEIVGLIPCVENMPDGTALKPGDVVKTHSGKTIEVISTDAEGRLILADAIAYSLRFNPHMIVDIATLTGSVSIALGTRIAGVVGNDQRLIDELVAAGDSTGEPVWPLPLDDHFREMIKGDISDYKNFAGKDGATITAAALLGEFVGGTPWVHVDIAGTFWSQDSKASYRTKGATGYGVDLLLRFLEVIASKTKDEPEGGHRPGSRRRANAG
jgi:leucyl aminopeptidase